VVMAATTALCTLALATARARNGDTLSECNLSLREVPARPAPAKCTTAQKAPDRASDIKQAQGIPVFPMYVRQDCSCPAFPLVRGRHGLQEHGLQEPLVPSPGLSVGRAASQPDVDSETSMPIRIHLANFIRKRCRPDSQHCFSRLGAAVDADTIYPACIRKVLHPTCLILQQSQLRVSCSDSVSSCEAERKEDEAGQEFQASRRIEPYQRRARSRAARPRVRAAVASFFMMYSDDENDDAIVSIRADDRALSPALLADEDLLKTQHALQNSKKHQHTSAPLAADASVQDPAARAANQRNDSETGRRKNLSRRSLIVQDSTDSLWCTGASDPRQRPETFQSDDESLSSGDDNPVFVPQRILRCPTDDAGHDAGPS